MQRLRRRGLGVLEFPGRQARGERREHRAGGLLHVDSGVTVDPVKIALKKCASALCRELRAWMPSIIIESAQQWR
jgi:hypothetical protein